MIYLFYLAQVINKENNTKSHTQKTCINLCSMFIKISVVEPKSVFLIYTKKTFRLNNEKKIYTSISKAQRNTEKHVVSHLIQQEDEETAAVVDGMIGLYGRCSGVLWWVGLAFSSTGPHRREEDEQLSPRFSSSSGMVPCCCPPPALPRGVPCTQAYKELRRLRRNIFN